MNHENQINSFWLADSFVIKILPSYNELLILSGSQYLNFLLFIRNVQYKKVK